MLIFLAVLAISAVATTAVADPTVHDVLRAHGLPIGLVPRSVNAFQIDTNGNFLLTLAHPCTAKFENELHYERNITGTISYGQIVEIVGITAQELFLWFPVKGIRVDIPASGLIYFDVGVILKQFSLALFETPPDCLDTDNDSVARAFEKVCTSRNGGRFKI